MKTIGNASSFRLIDEKHVSSEIIDMCWSPTMDLIAVTNVRREVVLHRHSWQKVWTMAALPDESRIRSIVWRPDGKVLSVAYSTGKVHLCDVENASVLHTLKFISDITYTTWLSETAEVKVNGNDCFDDLSAHYLPKLSPFTRGDENVEDGKNLKDQTSLNILLVGTADGKLHMYAFGIFPVGTLDMHQFSTHPTSMTIRSVQLSADLRFLTLLTEGASDDGQSSDAYLMLFDTSLLATRRHQIRTLALKFGHIMTLLSYLDYTIEQMTEAWEDILMEMDSKLKKFAEEKYKVCGGSVSNDFLRLLMLGSASDELQTFLLHDLSEKGLKKLGQSIESSYCNIQKLVLKHLHSVGGALMFHYEDIRGMSQLYDRYGMLGLSTSCVQQAIASVGAFMLKASELQQVIDASMKNLKAFFWWLYVVIQRLSDEAIPPGLSKMTERDLNFVAHFLKANFTEEMDGTKSGFKLEKVGQYLKNTDLQEPSESSANLWLAFLAANPHVADSPLLYRAEPKKSLVQVHTSLKECSDAALNCSSSVIGDSVRCVTTTHIVQIAQGNDDAISKISQASHSVANEVYIYTAFTSTITNHQHIYMIRNTTSRTEAVAFRFTDHSDNSISSDEQNDSSDSWQVVDLSFYDGCTLSVLLRESTGGPVLLQLPLSLVDEHFTPVVDSLQLETLECLHLTGLGEDVESRRLDKMKASRFAVSGTRKVACVLFASRHRVRLFLMDAEEEEEDEDEDDSHEETHGCNEDYANEGEDKENYSLTCDTG